MSESMFGAPCASVLKPTRKNLKFTKMTGSSSEGNWVNANVSMSRGPRRLRAAASRTYAPSTDRTTDGEEEAYDEAHADPFRFRGGIVHRLHRLLHVSGRSPCLRPRICAVARLLYCHGNSGKGSAASPSKSTSMLFFSRFTDTEAMPGRLPRPSRHAPSMRRTSCRSRRMYVSCLSFFRALIARIS